MKPGAVHKSPGIFLTAEKNSGKCELGDRLMKDVRPVIASNGGPLHPNGIGRITEHVRKGEWNKF